MAGKHAHRKGSDIIAPAAAYFGAAFLIMVGSAVYGKPPLTALIAGLGISFYVIYRLFLGRGVLYVSVLILAFSAALISVESDPYNLVSLSLIFASVFLVMSSVYLEHIKDIDNFRDVAKTGLLYMGAVSGVAFLALLGFRYLTPASPSYLTAILIVAIAAIALYLLSREM